MIVSFRPGDLVERRCGTPLTDSIFTVVALDGEDVWLRNHRGESFIHLARCFSKVESEPRVNLGFVTNGQMMEELACRRAAGRTDIDYAPYGAARGAT